VHSEGQHGGYHFVTLATRNHRPYLSDRHGLVTQAVDRLGRLPGVRIEYCRVLSDHVQLIVALPDCCAQVGELVRRLKASTSRRSGIRLWAPHHYDRPLGGDGALKRVREYVRLNPVIERLDWDDL
jgi:REP element-mobilizing transposase RayT